MSRFPEASDPDEWQPATSRPGELFTFEGQLRAERSFLRGLKNDDPRLKRHRRSMLRIGALFLGLAVGVAILVSVVAALL